MFWGVVFGDEDVWGDAESEFVVEGFVVVGPGVLGGWEEFFVSFVVGGAELVCAVLDEDVPDDEGVFDCFVFVVE